MRLFVTSLLWILVFQASYAFEEDTCEPIGTEICLDSSTKTVNGFDLTKCWKSEQRFKCISKERSDCELLEGNRGCYESTVNCKENTEFGLCKHLEKRFVCGSSLEARNEVKPIAMLLGPAPKDCKPGTYIDECKSLAKDCKEVSRNCLHYEGDNCDHYEVKYICEEGSGEKIDCISMKLCEGGMCKAPERKKHNNFGNAVSHLGILTQMKDEVMEGCKCPDGKAECLPEEIDEKSCTFFSGKKGQCRKVTGEFNCCTDNGILVGAFQCNQEEKDLLAKRKKGLCHFVGAWNGKGEERLKREEYFCCFNSKLTRIIQVGGRKGLNLSWGGARNPVCSGLSLEDIQKIDFSTISFEEIFDDVKEKAQTMMNGKQQEIMDYLANIKSKQNSSIDLINTKIQEFYKRGKINE